MITGKDQRHVRRQSSAQSLAHGIDSRQLLQPVNRVAAVHVPVMIKLALVRIDHGAIAAQGCIDDQRNPQVLGIFVGEGDESCSAECGLGKPSALEAGQATDVTRTPASLARSKKVGLD